MEEDQPVKYSVADMALAPEGKRKISWATSYMPVLGMLKRKHAPQKPLSGMKIATCLHLEAKTACLLQVLSELGAEVTAAGSNPLSTQDDVCAALAESGVGVYSHRGMSASEYAEHLDSAVSIGPDIVIDDGADMVVLLHEKRTDLMKSVRGGSEETTTGVKRLKAMEKDGVLKFPMIAVNDAKSKFLFDNRYGTGQSVLDGFMRTTNVLVAGKVVVVAGYGWCGRGVASRASGMGARVLVVETDPHRALEALMDGHDISDMQHASAVGDIFFTLTGNTGVIRKEHFALMKDGVILGNAGHFDVEVSRSDLEEMARETTNDRPNVLTYHMENGNRIHLLGEGRLVNLAAGDGHPVEIMDLSFALQLESALYMAGNTLKPGVYAVPEATDKAVVEAKLQSLGLVIEKLTPQQVEYMDSWRE
ncbi:MAG: adenosylhomocysteinase [Synergistota bacterium]|nr:adenosylhomocysteinase [Synergistota bacterium]